MLIAGGALRFGAVADLVSKPVMTGFLFGLGMVVALAQVPALLGVEPGEGDFFAYLADVLDELGEVHGTTLAVGAASIAGLILGKRLVPRVPSTLLVLVLAIVVSALLNLDEHGVDVVGHIPDALPDPAIPDVSADDLVALIAPALGVLILSAEAVGVARALAVKHGYRVDPNQDLMAMGASNALAGLSSGFVQSGGASQTAAADGAGGRSQMASVVAAVLLLATGAFLAPVFEHLPQATLAAIVIVAIAGFFDVAGIRRLARIRRSALVFAGLALAGVLALGVLQGLIVTAGLSLVYVVARISRPTVTELRREDDEVVVRIGARSSTRTPTRSRTRCSRWPKGARRGGRPRGLDRARRAGRRHAARAGDELRRVGAELRLANVQPPALDVLRRAGVTDQVAVVAAR